MTPKIETIVDKDVEKSFLKLQQIESEIQRADAKVEQFKNNLFTPIYHRRRKYLENIPKFWYVVFAQHEDFQEYVTVEDMKYIELITDLYVEFWDKTNIEENDEITKESLPKKGFTISISFKSSDSGKDNLIKDQTVTKSFEWIIDPESGSRQLQSTPVNFEWPNELKKIDPVFIKAHAKNESRSLTSDEKKKYRQGMRSFFSFWQWTGLKPGKEYRNGEDLATLIAEDIFPAALDYYVLAVPGFSGNADNDNDEDEESGEELDLSDHDVDDDDNDDDRESGDLKRQKKNLNIKK
jgi:hypothetical protein